MDIIIDKTPVRKTIYYEGKIAYNDTEIVFILTVVEENELVHHSVTLPEEKEQLIKKHKGNKQLLIDMILESYYKLSDNED
jgi:hypothetical protein